MSSQFDDFEYFEWEEDYDPYKAEEKPTTVPTLEKIAAVKVAIALWHHATVAIPGFITNNDDWYDSLHDTVLRWIEDALLIPKLLGESIHQNLRRVDDNIRSWCWHLGKAVIESPDTVALSTSHQLIDCFIFHPNGRINLVKTARNVLKSDKLNNVQKFHLASAYCLREEIEKIWPTLEKIDHGFADGCALSSFWACFCKKELGIMNLGFTNVHSTVVNWSAIEYFFDRVNTEKQVRTSIYFIDKFGIRFQKLLLMKLNKSQRISVLEENIICIIRNYFKSEDHEEDAIATWNEFRNLITQDQFVNLLSELLINGIKDSILTEIWNTARDDCKHRVLNNDYYDFIEKVFVNWLTKYKETSLTFLSSLLFHLYRAGVDIGEEITKKPFFIYSCLRLCCSNLNLLDRVLNLCRLDAAASKKFKQSIIKSPYFNERCKRLMTCVNHFPILFELLDFAFSITNPSSTQFLREILSENMKLLNDRCLELYSDGDFEYLNASLAPLKSSYPEIVSEYKKNLLFSDEGLRICVNHFVSQYWILPEIIADGLPTDLAAEFKRKIISSPEAIDKLKSMMVNRQSNAAMELIDQYLESKKARKKLRKKLRMM